MNPWLQTLLTALALFLLLYGDHIQSKWMILLGGIVGIIALIGIILYSDDNENKQLL